MLSLNPETGIREDWHQDADGNVVIQRVQDVQDIVDVAQRRFNDQKASTPYGEFAKVASIPLSILEQLRRDGTLADPERFKKWLNDPDNRMFRTRPGKL